MTYYAWCLITTDSDGHRQTAIPLGAPTDYNGTAKEYAEYRLRQQVGAMENAPAAPPTKLEVRVWEGGTRSPMRKQNGRSTSGSTM